RRILEVIEDARRKLLSDTVPIVIHGISLRESGGVDRRSSDWLEERVVVDRIVGASARARDRHAQDGPLQDPASTNDSRQGLFKPAAEQRRENGRDRGATRVNRIGVTRGRR